MSDTEKQEVETVETEIAEDANAPKKNAVPAEPTPLSNEAEDLGAAVVKPDDARKGPSDAGNKSKKVEDQVNKDAKDGSNPAGKGDFKPGTGLKEEEVETDAEEVVAEDTTEDVIDLSKDVEALVSADADLSEEFKEKAATIFETAVKTRLAEKGKEIQAKADKEVEEKTSAIKEELVEKVDSYLNYVVEEWIKDNKLAIDKGIRSEIAEDFISGLKKSFQRTLY